MPNPEPKTGPQAAPTQDAVREMREVAKRAKSGDAAAVPRLRELLDLHPEIWRHYGDLGRRRGSLGSTWPRGATCTSKRLRPGSQPGFAPN